MSDAASDMKSKKVIDDRPLPMSQKQESQAGCRRRKEARMMFVAGISFKTAPVALREQLAVTPSRLIETATRLKEQGGLSELALVSTCNRVELYGVADDAEGAGRVARVARSLAGGCLSLMFMSIRTRPPRAISSPSPAAWIRWSWAKRKSPARSKPPTRRRWRPG